MKSYRLSLLLAFITLAGFSPMPASARQWLIKNHSQIRTNIDRIGNEWKNISTGETLTVLLNDSGYYFRDTNDFVNRHFDVTRIGLSDGDPIKDASLDAGETTIGGEPGIAWMTANISDRPIDRNFIEIDLPEDFNLGDDDLVVFLKRHIHDNEEHPTGLMIVAGKEDTQWDWQYALNDHDNPTTDTDYSIPAEQRPDTIGYAYLQYRGFRSHSNEIHKDDPTYNTGTKEYSERIDIANYREKFNDGTYKKLRFYFILNNTKKRVKETDHKTNSNNRTCKLLSFNIMQLGKDENYSNILIDRFHHLLDYSYEYYDYEYVPTLGIFDKHNQKQNTAYYLLENYTKYPGESDSPWIEYSDETGTGVRWNKDLEWLELAEVTIPTYTQLTNKQDKRINTSTTVPGTNTENWRQPVHEQEHILYAIPGDIISLYPYSKIQEVEDNAYSIQFTHWYNYRTGGNCDYLDFLIDPTLVRKSKNYGYFGGKNLASNGYTKKDPSQITTDDPSQNSVIEIASSEEYIAFINNFNAGNYSNYPQVILTDDIKFTSEQINSGIPVLGNSSKKFNGTFDGNGKTVDNLEIYLDNSDNIGMFGYLGYNAHIMNLHVDNAYIKGRHNVGVIGYSDQSGITIENIKITNATIETTDNYNASNIGLLIGCSQDAGDNPPLEIYNCFVSGRVIGPISAGALGRPASYGRTNISNCIAIATLDDNVNTINSYYSQVRFAFVNDQYDVNSSYINCYSNQFSDRDIEKGLVKLVLADGKYQTEEGVLVESEAFANLLNGKSSTPVWCFESGSLSPFNQLKSTNSDDSDEEDSSFHTDLIENLSSLEELIFTHDNPNNKTGIFSEGSNEKIKDSHKIGTVATFYYPRNTDSSDLGIQRSLPSDVTSPNQSDDPDYLIAADLNCVFYKDANVVQSGTLSKIYEPTITFRHIFRIKDGKKFAEEFSGSPEKNKDYVSHHRHIVASTINPSELGYGAPSDLFQIKLDHPVPVKYDNKFSAPMDIYYKISDTDYRRVRSCDIEVYEIINDKVSSKPIANQDLFSFQYSSGKGATSKGVGHRTFDNTTYQLCDDDAEYYRMLFCENHAEGRYLVRLIGLDINNNPIKVYDPSTGTTGSEKLIVAEYDISFLPASQATLKKLSWKGEGTIPDEDLKLFKDDDTNKIKYGTPLKVDFDQYRYLDNHRFGSSNIITGDGIETGVLDDSDYLVSDSKNSSYLKWPLPWDVSSYGFPYSKDLHTQQAGEYNFNVYMLANNTDAVEFHEAVADIKDIHYLRSIYKNETPEKGFFYWVNAADDPGIAANIELDDMCTGSTIHVSAWLMDTSDKTNYCNVVFNFVAILEDGTKEYIHSFVSGEIASGNWTKVSYEFTPNATRIKRIQSEGIIDHYELELESNAKGSDGADFTLDDVRMYVAHPALEADQLQPICDTGQISTKVKIQIPFEPLLSALGVEEYVDEVTDSEDDVAQADKQMQLARKFNSAYYSASALKTEGAENYQIYYTFLDKEIFKKYYRSLGYTRAFNKAQLVYDYDTNLENGSEKFGVLSFSNQFSANESYPDPVNVNTIALNTAFCETSDKIRYLTFVTQPEALQNGEDDHEEYLVPGHEYIIAIIVKASDGSSYSPAAADFDLLNSCSYVGEFVVKSANTISISNNGITEDTTNGPFCLGSTPIVRVDLKGYTSDFQYEFDIEQDYFDWYAGDADSYLDEYITYTEESNGGESSTTTKKKLYLSEALSKFRSVYPDADINSLAAIDNVVATEKIGQPYIDYIKEMSEKRHKDGRRMLVLHAQTYQFYPLIASVNDSVNVVTAIPIYEGVSGEKTLSEMVSDNIINIDTDAYSDLSEDVLSQKVVICLQPMEVRLKVSGDSPYLFQGFDDITYPSEMASVPIRIGLRQIQQTWGVLSKTEFTSEKEKSESERSIANTLCIPLKNIYTPSELSTGIKTGWPEESTSSSGNAVDIVEYDTSDWIIGEPIYLIETDDPRFETLLHYPIVGQVVRMVANEKKSVSNPNAIYVRFDGLEAKENGNGIDYYPHYFNFREGCYYTMKFNIQEKGSSTFKSSACLGQHVFTIKVVPEYVAWNGTDINNEDDRSLNWNNDANWRRVVPEEIFPSMKDGEIALANGVDAKTVTVLPGYGSSAIAKGTAIYDFNPDAPRADASVSDIGNTNFIYKYTASKDIPEGMSESYDYYMNSGDDAFMPMDFTKVIIPTGSRFPNLYEIPEETKTNGAWSQLSDEDMDYKGAGYNIHYDMLTVNGNTSEKILTLKPWQANRAQQVHFQPDTEIGGQQYLQTDKIWVEMEMNPDGWYTVSSPLQSVYAGDMYLPTLGARQVSPLFEGVNFRYQYENDGTLTQNNDINDRFRSAVYQRSWNLANDKVYEIDGTDRNVFRSVNWSHVYNNVAVGYNPGEGFSIKTDVSGATAPKEKVLFRFPKEDISYTYFDSEGNTGNKSDDTVTKDSSKHGKLNPANGTITVRANGNSQFFLVGNPFMAHLDMAKFLNVNSTKIERKFWILNSEHQSVTIIDEDAVSDDLYLPPMTGFFVKATAISDDLSIDYTADMAIINIDTDSGKTGWLSRNVPSVATRSADSGYMVIYAERDGKTLSHAKLRVGNGYHNGFVDDEDAEVLIDPHLNAKGVIYTIADNQALAINSTPDASGTEIGLMTDTDAETVIRFEGSEANNGYHLYDALNGKAYDVYDGMEYRLKGPAASRLYLSDAPESEIIKGLKILAEENEIRVIPAVTNSEIDVMVCDVAGIVVLRKTVVGETHFTLDSGSYIISASASDGSNTQRKLLIQ